MRGNILKRMTALLLSGTLIFCNAPYVYAEEFSSGEIADDVGDFSADIFTDGEAAGLNQNEEETESNNSVEITRGSFSQRNILYSSPDVEFYSDNDDIAECKIDQVTENGTLYLYRVNFWGINQGDTVIHSIDPETGKELDKYSVSVKADALTLEQCVGQNISFQVVSLSEEQNFNIGFSETGIEAKHNCAVSSYDQNGRKIYVYKVDMILYTLGNHKAYVLGNDNHLLAELDLTIREHVWGTDYVTDKEATCTEKGSQSIHCSLCDVMKEGTKEEIPTKDHIWDEGKVTREPTCTEKGEKTFLCTVCCKEMKTEEIEANGHTWNEQLTVDSEATCTAPGVQSIHCSVCDAVKEGSEKEIPAKKHIWSSGKITKIPTCTEKGQKTYTCIICGGTRQEDIEKGEHIWNKEYSVDKEASCTEKGIKSIHCSVCDSVLEGSEEVIPMTGHSWDAENIIKAPTCTEKGMREICCSRCGIAKGDGEEEIPAKGHSWNEIPTVDKEATCTEVGSQSIHCNVCDAVKEESIEEIPMKSHSWDEGEVMKEPTCTEPGIRKIHCIQCGAEKEGAESTIPALGHDWGEWKQTVTPTTTRNGKEERTCRRCNKTESRIVAALPLNLAAVSVNAPNVVAGDNILLSWSAVKDADGYIVYRKESGSWERIAVLNGNILKYTDTDTQIGSTYRYTVKAFAKTPSGTVYGGYNKKGVLIQQTYYKDPLVITSADAVSTKKVRIRWNARKKNTGYVIYRKTAGASWKGIKIVRNVTEYTDSTCQPATTYYYTVRAYTKNGGINYYSPYMKKGLAVTTNMLRPTVKAVSDSKNTATVSWSRQSGVNGYVIYRKSSTAGKWKRIKTMSAKYSSYTEKGLKSGSSYIYTVRPYKKITTSEGTGKILYGPYQKTGVKVRIK